MAQYIDKDTLVAEIEKRKRPFQKDIEDGAYPTYLCALMDFEDVINSLEVKEVDLEKEIKTHLKECWDIKFPTTNIKTIAEDVEYTARKFFELGLKAKGE